MEYLDLNLINNILNTLNLKYYKIYFFDIIDSTNSFALDNIDIFKNNDFSIILTENQTLGRGRFDRRWESQKFQGLTFSLVYKISNIDLRCFSLLIAVAVSEALNHFNIKNSIKWPNDIYIENKKNAGILIENRIRNKENNVVIGIGINQIVKVSRNYLLCYTIYYCNLLINDYLKNGFLKIKSKWLNKCMHLNKMVSIYKDGNKIISGINVGVNDNGELLIQDNNYNIKCYDTNISIKF